MRVSGINDTNFARCFQTSQVIEVPTGGNLKFEIRPHSTAYPVNSVKVDGNVVTEAFMAGNVTFTNISTNHTVEVTFEKVASHTITVNSPENTKSFFFEDVESGNTFWWGSMEFAAGKDVRLYYEPETGYKVNKAFITDSDGNSVNTVTAANDFNTKGYYEFKSLAADYEVSFQLTDATPHTVTVDFDNVKGWVDCRYYRSDPEIFNSFVVDPNTPYSFNEGISVRLVFGIREENAEFKSIELDGTEVTPIFNDSYGWYYYDLSTLSANHTVDVTFEEKPSVTVNYDSNYGSVGLSDYGNVGSGYPFYYSNGSTVRVEPYALDGYKVSSITVNESPVSLTADGYYEFTLTESCIVNVTFEEANSVSVCFDSDRGSVDITDYGTIASCITYTYSQGSTVRITPHANEGYVVKYITVDDTPVSLTNGYYEFTLNSAHNVYVGFNYPTVTVNFDNNMGSVFVKEKDEEGSYTWPSNTIYYPSGSIIRITPEPSYGYKIGSVTVDEAPVSLTNGYYEFTLSSNCIVEVTFEALPIHSIQVNYDSSCAEIYFPDGCVTEDPLNNFNFYEGSDVEMRIYAYGGYLPSFTIDNETVQLPFNFDNNYYYYNFENVRENHSVSVEFTTTDYSTFGVTYNASHAQVYLNSYEIGPNTGYLFTQGSTVRLKIVPEIGYELASILVNDEGVKSEFNNNGGYYYCYLELSEDYYSVTVTMQKKAAPTNVTLTLPASGEGTYCSEYDLNFRNVSGIKAYVASGFDPTNSQLVLTRVDEAPAGTGLLIKGTPGNYTIPTTNSNFLFANMLKGVVKNTYIPSSEENKGWYGDGQYANYILGTDGEFYKTTGEELPANSAYLMIPSRYVENNSLAKISTIFLDDEEEMNGIATGIGFIKAGEPKTITTNDDVYNLQGQKVNSKTLKPGIYIKNGKKFMVK